MGLTQTQAFNFKMLITLTLVILLSLLEYRLVVLLHRDNLNSLVQAAYGITIGEPHWRIYQSRLLGPFTVKFLAELFQVTYANMYMFFTLGLSVIKNGLGFYLFYRLTGNNQISLKYTLYLVASFIALQDVRWLYLWDYFDIIVFLMFIYGALIHQSNRYFLLLFVIALLNKESALFIPLWLILDALMEIKTEPFFYFAIKLRDFNRLLLGIILLVSGIYSIDWVRDFLYIRSVADPGVEFNTIEYGKHVHWKLLLNLQVFLDNFHQPSFSLPFLVNSLIILMPVFIITHFRQMTATLFKIVLVFFAIYGMIVMLGLINETRVYNILIPFIIFLSASFFGDIRKI